MITKLLCEIITNFKILELVITESTSELGKGNFMSTYDSGNRSDIVYGVFTTPV